MPRTQRTPRDERAPRRIRFLLGFLVVLALGGGAAVKFLQTTRGGILLVDAGLESALPRVEREIGTALKRSLEKSGLRRRLRVQSESGPAAWDLPCDDATDLLLVNVALTEATRAIGAVVRTSEETDGGRTLLFHVGTRTRDTHRLTIRRLATGTAARAGAPLPRIAIVIDDFGYVKGGIAGSMLDLDMPLTVAVLPQLRHSKDVLARARQRGRCVLLHLPMEARHRYPEDLEPITVDMNDHEITSLVGEYMESLPGVDGVNNHQGSRATADVRVMRAVCRVLGDYGVFFLDSLTSPESVAYNVAIEAGLRAVVNSEFIDDGTDRREEVGARLRGLVETARERGFAVGIGHPHPWTLEALREFRDFAAAADVELVSLCDLIESEKP